MNNTSIKNYAIWARNELISRVSQKAFEYGVEKDKTLPYDAQSINGRLLSDDEKKKRQILINEVKHKGYDQVIEEVAYTWFNRFIALRFMEVNNYLPDKVRLFTNENNEFKPQIIDEALHIELAGLDKNKVITLKEANNNEELYKELLLATCNDMSRYLPGMFKPLDDYMTLLFPSNLLREESVLGRLISDIDEDCWTDQVQIIGWLYQYYISNPKDVLINAKKQYKDADIPFVTQLFTPDWIVKYLVQNSLGRSLIGFEDAKEFGFEYYLDSENIPKTEPGDYTKLRVVDPCMGSGHILVYAFDILMTFYTKDGYNPRDAAQLILENNIYGFEISNRAYQLSYFSLMMKARKYNRNILKTGVKTHLYLLGDVDLFDKELIDFISKDNEDVKFILRLVNDKLRHAGIYGSLLSVEQLDYSKVLERIDLIANTNYNDLVSIALAKKAKFEVRESLEICLALSHKYDVVITNPPYVGNRLLSNNMRAFIEEHYVDFKSDLFAAFVAKVIEMCKPNGYVGMLTPYVWMFISTYERLRNKVLNETQITSLVQLEYNAFEAACVPVCCFTLKKTTTPILGEYIRLSEFKGADIQAEKVEEAVSNPLCDYRYSFDQREYWHIPGNPIAYWVRKEFIAAFTKGFRVDDIASPKQGLATADNNTFLRLWFEVDAHKIGFSCSDGQKAIESNKKWFPYNKGGGFKKWYGNNEYVINWENDGYELRHYKGSVIRSPQYYFRKGISWCKITSSSFSMRYIPEGFLFDVAGCTLFSEEKDLLYLLGYMNSSVNSYILALISPTLNYEVGHVASLPIIFPEEEIRIEVEKLVKNSINLCKKDWDSTETSWDFSRNPLVNYGKGRLTEIYKRYEKFKKDEFFQLKENEERLNQIFADIYDAKNIVNIQIPEEEIIIGRANYLLDVKSLISYAVGCMFGRYSLDIDGLAYAGGEWDESKYKTFIPDKDNIIPICDDEYFNDDITGRFVEFIKEAYGEDTLEENLRFIADALGGKGTSREVIRSYFINDFYKDHCDGYTSRGAGKRPIYWQFDSGKKNGFKALIYIHRYTPDLIARMRTSYVHEQQSRYDNQISMIQNRIDSAASTSEKVKAEKELKKLKEQADELRVYEEKIHHWADKMEPIDLDDGVKANYAKFQDLLTKIK